MEFYQNPNSQSNGQGQPFVFYGSSAPQNGGPMPNDDERLLKKQEKENDKNNIKTMGKRFGIAVILYVVLSFAISFLVMAISKIVPSVNLIYEDNYATLAYSVVGSVFYIGIPFALVYASLKKKQLTGVLPFGTPYNTEAAIYLTMITAPVMIISSMIVNAISLIIQSALGLSFESGLEDLSMPGVGGFFIGAISMAVVPAIIEEFAIRGVVMQPLRRYGDGFAIVVSALVFSIMHGNMAQIPYTVLGGIYLGYLAIATGSIWPSIIVHFVNNMYSVVVMSVDSNFGESASGVAAIMMIGALIVVGIIGAIKFFSMNYKTKLEKGVENLKTAEKGLAVFANVPMIIAIVIMIIITLTSIQEANGQI